MVLHEERRETVEQLVGGLFGADGHEDPYPYYRALRTLAPVLTTPWGALVLGHADCSAVLQDHAGLRDPGRSLAIRGYPDWRERPSLRLNFESMLARNPPDHTRLRRLVSKAFTRREVERLIPAIESFTDDLVRDMRERASGGEPIELISACASPLPVWVVGELLGVPPADRPMFQQWVLDSSMVLETQLDEQLVRRADAAAVCIVDYFETLIAERRARPADDLTSRLALIEDDGERLGHDELVQTLALLMGAGFETTSNLIANSVVALIEHPDQLSSWRDAPGLTEQAVEELLRFDSPVQNTLRSLGADLRLPSGAVLAHDSLVVVLMGAGNRDPARYEEPDELRLDRADPRPLSFGGGIHHCLGAPLARVEARVLFPRLLDAFPSWERAPGAQRRPGLTIRGFTALPVQLN